jgi:hypothetical protein
VRWGKGLSPVARAKTLDQSGIGRMVHGPIPSPRAFQVTPYMIAVLSDILNPMDAFWILPIYFVAIGILESRARSKDREHLTDVLGGIIKKDPATLERSVRTLFPKTAVWIPLIGAAIIVVGMLLIRLDGNHLRIAELFAMGKPAYCTLILVIAVVVNDFACIRYPPWPKRTVERLRKSLKGDSGDRVLDMLAEGHTPAARAQLRKKLAEEFLPDLFGPFLTRLVAQQGLRLGLSVALVLCSVIAKAK